MISLEHLLLDQGVLEAEFSCDLNRCKGACCTMPGGAGAPVLQEEIQQITDAVEFAKPYLSKISLHHLQHHGAVIEEDGKRWTQCIDDKDCVFVVYEDDVAVCSIEKSWHEGKQPFRKPLSCHLFPIRVADFGGPYLHYEQFDECKPGRANGKKSGTLLVESTHVALERAYGTAIADEMLARARTQKQLRDKEAKQ